MRSIGFFLSFIFILSKSFGAETMELPLLKKLVEISSGSNDKDGVGLVQDIIASDLRSLGFKVEGTTDPNGKLAPLIVGTLRGKQPQFITFIVHADTVFEKNSTFSGFKMSSDEKLASGPGVIDDKGGIVVLLTALKQYLSPHSVPKYSLRVISSPGEEVGSPAFIPQFKSYSLDSILALGLEPSLDNGSLIDSRRGNRWYSVRVVGREAHAGRAHKEGINACWELSKKLDAISKLTNYRKDLTVSIGHIEGGKDKFNIVCGEATAKIDVRFSDLTVRDQFHRQFENIMKKSNVNSVSDHKSSETTFEISDDTPPFSPNKDSLSAIRKLIELIKKHEKRQVLSEKSGGAADINHFSRPGLAIIDGLGAYGGKMHTSDEFIVLSSIKSRADVLSDFLTTF